MRCSCWLVNAPNCQKPFPERERCQKLPGQKKVARLSFHTAGAIRAGSKRFPVVLPTPIPLRYIPLCVRRRLQRAVRALPAARYHRVARFLEWYESAQQGALHFQWKSDARSRCYDIPFHFPARKHVLCFGWTRSFFVSVLLSERLLWLLLSGSGNRIGKFILSMIDSARFRLRR